MGDFIFVIIGIVIFIFRKIFESDFKSKNLRKVKRGIERPVEDPAHELFREVDKENIRLTNKVRMGEEKTVFSEADDRVKASLYFAIFKATIFSLIAIIVSIIYFSLVK